MADFTRLRRGIAALLRSPSRTTLRYISLHNSRLYAQCEQVAIFPMDGEHIYKEKEIIQ